MLRSQHLGTEAVQGLALTLQRVDNVQSRHSLAARMLSVRNGILHDVLKEALKNTARLLVHETRNALNATTACETTDRGLRDALDVLAKDLLVTLGSALALATLAFAGHGESMK